MKKISKLASLPVEDQRFIIDLCDQTTYPQAIALLAKPREHGGLGLQTNPSALSRFLQQYSWIAEDTQVLLQFTDVLQAQPNCSRFTDSIITLLEQFLFRALLNKTSLDDLKVPFRTLLNLQRLQFSRLKWHTEHRLPLNQPAPIPLAETTEDEFVLIDPPTSNAETVNPSSLDNSTTLSDQHASPPRADAESAIPPQLPALASINPSTDDPETNHARPGHAQPELLNLDQILRYLIPLPSGLAELRDTAELHQKPA